MPIAIDRKEAVMDASLFNNLSPSLVHLSTGSTRSKCGWFKVGDTTSSTINEVTCTSCRLAWVPGGELAQAELSRRRWAAEAFIIDEGFEKIRTAERDLLEAERKLAQCKADLYLQVRIWRPHLRLEWSSCSID